MSAATTQPTHLHFTGDDEADALLARDPLALLIGFALDQQVTVQKAFSGPLELQRRLGSLDAARIAGMGAGELEEVFRQKPAIHRFPGAMAGRVQELCRAVVSEYGGDAGSVWGEAADSADLKKRLASLPGFGEMKVKSLGAVLAKRYGLELAAPLAPSHPTLGDVDSVEALNSYQAAKRAHKAAVKAASLRPGRTARRRAGSSARRRIASSSGRPPAVSAAASTCGKRVTSPTVSRKTPSRASAQWTASSICAGSVSGSYQVAAVCSRPSQPRSAIDLIVCSATPRSAQVAASASNSRA